MTYSEILYKLFNINKFGVKLGLSNVKKLLDALGNPEKSFQSVHVAGTNGKGSVTTKIAYGSAKKTGLFTSPHICTFRERIRIDGQMISEDDTTRLLCKIFHLQDKLGIQATFFELTTVLCFLYFAEMNVEFAAIETGLGGRLDATNILLPVLSVITSISYDHKEILGHTLEEITLEKAGIVKHGVPVLIGPRVPHNIVKSVAIAKEAPIYRITETFSTYQEENDAIARCAMQLLQFSPKDVLRGLQASPSCRYEIISTNPPIICDVAHNPDGLKMLFAQTKKSFENIEVVLGLSHSKDKEECLRTIFAYGVDHLYLVKADSERGACVSELLQIALRIGLEENRITTHQSVAEGIRVAKSKQKKNLLLITGTFFMMREARRELGFDDPCDFVDLYEPAKSPIVGIKESPASCN